MPLGKNFRVQDKAVLRKKKIYTYDSRIENTEYGVVQKGSVIMKAARLTWYGKVTEAYNFPQVGTGRK